MTRKRLTQIFPFLIPIRTWQKNLFYQVGMILDKNKYSVKMGDLLDYEICSSKSWMINENSGQDIVYQQNKVHNLKIISKTMDRLLIYPGEVFSFCYLAKNSRKYGKYKDGLILVDGKTVTRKGGGVCHLSNLLYYTFLKSPLTLVERHGHKMKPFPNPDPDSLDGVDATIVGGWLDLKVRNDTDDIYQLKIDIDNEYLYVKILSNKKCFDETIILNENFHYVRKNGKVYEKFSVVKQVSDKRTKKVKRKYKLYDEVIEVGYELDSDVEIKEEDV